MNINNILGVVTVDKILNKGYQIVCLGNFNCTTDAYRIHDKCVVKIYYSMSKPTHEFEILKFIQSHSTKSYLFPIPYLCFNKKYECVECMEINIYDVFKICVYEYIDGISCDIPSVIFGTSGGK
jgi:hypothetical protein